MFVQAVVAVVVLHLRRDARLSGAVLWGGVLSTSVPGPAASSEMLLRSLFSGCFWTQGGKKEETKAAPLSRCPDDRLMLDRAANKAGFPLNFKMILPPSLKYYKVRRFCWRGYAPKIKSNAKRRTRRCRPHHFSQK